MSDLLVDRPLTLAVQADWGMFNLTRVAGWLSLEITDRSAPGTRVAIWNGRGFVDNVRALGRGEVDVAITTPSAFVRLAVDGNGPYAEESFPDLRAIASVPQRDRMVFAVPRELGISTFAQLRQARPALTWTSSRDDGISHVGLAVGEVFARSGVDVEGWGGTMLDRDRPFDCLDDVEEGRAQAIAFEGVMVPGWQRIAPGMTFLPVEEEVLASLEADLGWPSATVEEGYFLGAPSFATLDFSDFLVVVRADMDDDVARALAWIMWETRDGLEAQYRHIPPERSPVTYPLDRTAMFTTPILLHDGAAAYAAGTGEVR